MSFEIALYIALAVLVLIVFSQLHRVEATLDQVLTFYGMPASDSRPPSAEVVALASAGERIEAMRRYRQQTGADIRKAIKVVDELARRSLLPETRKAADAR